MRKGYQTMEWCHTRHIILQGPLQYWRALWSAQMFLRVQQCVQTSCVRCDVAGPMAEVGFCCVRQRAGATEGSHRTAVAVCSRRQAQTEQKRDEENCTLIDEILVRTVVFLGAFAKLRKATISIVMRVCPSAWNISAIFLKFGISLFSKICREKQNSLISDRCH